MSLLHRSRKWSKYSNTCGRKEGRGREEEEGGGGRREGGGGRRREEEEGGGGRREGEGGRRERDIFNPACAHREGSEYT